MAEKVPAEDSLHVSSRIESIRFDLHDACTYDIFCNHKRFVVTLSPDIVPGFDSVGTFEGDFLKRLDAAQEPESNPSEQYKIIVSIEGMLQNLCQPHFREVAPLTEASELKNTLDVVLYPQTIMLQLVTLNGEAKIIKRDDIDPPTHDFRYMDPMTLTHDVPRYLPSQLEVVEKLVSIRVIRVLVDGKIMCCKLDLALYPDTLREIDTLSKLALIDLHESIRIPRLRGLIVAEDGRGVIGFLMDHVETIGPNPHLGGYSRKMDTTDRCRREKWASQAEMMVKALHDNGIVWGDAKADNLLLDANDDVWLADFGGGRTEGWVVEDKKETKEGDLHALQMLREFLKL
ncbi:MAG: hypothetical protein M1833_003364 [Piccolia ochrophora]|nr:MAG: hypothetical protein M1833_003364 [Piccolia ochrophora]